MLRARNPALPANDAPWAVVRSAACRSLGGLIGLGPMGQALAKSLLDAGYATTVWNGTESKLRNRFSQILSATAGGPVRLSDDDRQRLDRARRYELSCRTRRDVTNAGEDISDVRILSPTHRPAQKGKGSG
jgi:hypothetical protein